MEEDMRIRKLTPKECFRLMGFDDESFERAEAVNSNSQLYKQAGNSIVVDVLEELFGMMLDENGDIQV
jgi:DNA (cytosine-5)-methyltransferase 1